MEDIKKQQDEIKKEFLSFKMNTQASIKALEVNQQKLTENQQFINAEFEVCKSNQKTTKERAKSAEAKIVNLNAQLQSFHETLREEQNRINDLEQYGRRNMIEISNIPLKKDKNLQSVITALAKSMEVKDFTYEMDVDVAHRLNSKLTPPPVIKMFRSRTKRNDFYEKRKALKNIKLQDLNLGFQENSSVFLNESLALHNAILFKKVRGACKKNSYKFYWTSNGKILCKSR